MFSLFTKNANIYIYKVKGGTAKGLTKHENENRIKITSMVSRFKYKCGIFNFGQVDIHHSFYFNIFKKKQSSDELIEVYEKVAYDYVEFINSLDLPLKVGNWNIKQLLLLLIYYDEKSMSE